MKFNRLSTKAKCVAVAEYLIGFYQTHDEDDGFSAGDAFDILDEGDDEFNEDGSFIESEKF